MQSRHFFDEAFRLAETVKGGTSPNPAVGCLLVSGDRVIGRGATQKAGKEHAEVMALREAGRKAKGTTMFVTLEPCVDFPGKRTPGCSGAIIAAGVREVVIGTEDPNPNVNGRGIEQLRAAGVRVRMETSRKESLLALNEDFFKFIRTSLPFVYAKYAMTLDGNIADIDGGSQWISGDETLEVAHRLRNRVDAILVGIGTVKHDNPRLNVRIPERIKDPLRLVLDPRGETPPEHHVMNDHGRTLFVVEEGKVPDSFRENCERHHKMILELPHNPGLAGISLAELFRRLGTEKKIASVMIEGGGSVLSRAFRERVIDKVMCVVAPKLIGGRGIPPFNGNAPLDIARSLTLERSSAEIYGRDVLIQGYVKWD